MGTVRPTSSAPPHWLQSEVLVLEKRLPVQLLDSVSRCLPDVRGQVGRRLLDRQHHDGDDNGDPDTGQNPKRAGPNELVWVLEEGKKTGCGCVRGCKNEE